MAIRRLLDIRTHITLDTSNFFNDATNFFFIPIHFVFAQNEYKSLQGKVEKVDKAPEPVTTPVYGNLKKIAKVFMFFVAIIPTILGLVTRRLSLLSPEVDQAYSIAFLLQLHAFEQKPDLLFSSFGFLRKKTEEERNRLLLNPDFPFTQLFLSLQVHQSYTNAFLLSLDANKRREFLVKLPLEIQSAFISLETNQTLALECLQNLTTSEFNQLVPFLSPSLLQQASQNRVKKIEQAGGIQAGPAGASAPVPALPSAQVELSAVDEPVSTPDPDATQNKGSIAPTLEQSLPSFEFDFPAVQSLIFDITALPIREQVTSLENEEIALIGKRVNEYLRYLNLFFGELLGQEKTLETWVEKNQEFFKCHPMGASHYLSVYLEKSILLSPHLDQTQLAAWKQNYPQCVLMLKLNSLESFVETEFPFDQSHKESVEKMKKGHENPKIVEDLLKESDNPPFPPLIFFRNLDRQLNALPQDKVAINTWLQSELSKPNYDHYFYKAKEVKDLPFAEDDPQGKELKKLYESCSTRLSALNLGHYFDETLPAKVVAERKSRFAEHKGRHQKLIEGCLSALRPLSELLRKNSAASESIQRKTVEAWFSNFKANRNYEYPFFFVPMFLAQRLSFPDTFDEAEIQELEQLHTYCQDMLRALKLEAYLKEAPGKPSVKKRKLTFSERFTNENEFFKQLFLQDEKVLVAWLALNSPPHDYPLLWGKKRLSEVENYRDTAVDSTLRGDWKKNFEACQAKLTSLGLQSHLDTDYIPSNASRELRDFINPKDPVLFMDFGTEPEDKYKDLHQEIEASIQNPAIELNRHLQYYLNRHPLIIERIIPPKLLSRWKTAVGVSATPPTLPDEEHLKAATTFFMEFCRRTKGTEGTASTLRWLDEQKTHANYAFPFYHALYWQTLANPEEHSKLKTLSEFHKKAIDWAHINDQKHRLLETPPGPQGVHLLVHRLTGHLLKPSFTAVIVKLVPRMAPLLEKKEMFPFWESSLVDRAKQTVQGWIDVYDRIQSINNKSDIIRFLDSPKEELGIKAIVLLSKGNIQLVDLLAPILPPGLPSAWRQAYDDCCRFIQSHGIPDQDYIDVPALGFLEEDQPIFQQRIDHQFKLVFTFFKNLKREKNSNVKSTIEKACKENPYLTPFWFAKHIDDLLIGYNVSLTRKELKEFKEIFTQTQVRLNELHLEAFLNESPPKMD